MSDILRLESRICHSLVVAQIPGIDGNPAKCIGKECSSYEACLYSILSNHNALCDALNPGIIARITEFFFGR